MKKRGDGMEITVVKGDITEQDVDVIVNAANPGLLGGGGVDGAIHQAAGPDLLKECQEVINRIGTCPAGEAVITSAGDLQASYIIHAVGPIWKDGEHQEANKLASCYWKALDLAAGKDLTSIAFPRRLFQMFHVKHFLLYFLNKTTTENLLDIAPSFL